MLGGDTSLPQVSGVPAVKSVTTEAEWVRLVDKARSHGIGALSDVERVQLIAGSVKAYLKSVSSVTLGVEVSGESRGTIVERYALDEDGFFTKLAIRTERLRSTEMPWTNRPYDDASAPDERRVFFVLADGTSTGIEDWSRHGDIWSCARESAEGYDTFRLKYAIDLLSIPHGIIEPMTNKGAAVKIRVRQGVNEMTYWIDAFTFWPVRIEYPQTATSPPSSITVAESTGSEEPPRPAQSPQCV